MTRRTRKGPTAPVGRGSIRDLAELQELGEELERPGAAGARDAAESTVMPSATGVSGSGFTAGTTTWLDRFSGVSLALSAELDLDRLARTILDQARRLLQADRGILFLGRPDAAGLVPICAVDVQGEELQEISRVSRTILGRARAGELVITGNAPADARFSTIRSIRLNEMRSIICGPLVSPSGIVGALYLDAVGAHAFAEPATEFFRAMAGIAAVALEKAILHGELIRENRELRDRLRSQLQDQLPGHFREPSTESAATGATMGSILGAGEAIEQLRHQVVVAARLDGPVLLVGESGTGRRTLARAIHQASRRLGQPFVVFDFDAIPPDHHRSVLMGRTGPAVKTYPHPEPGMVRQAEPGSLYLAGVESLPSELAPGIARLGEKGLFRPLGSRRDEQANIRLFVARTEIPTGRDPSGETGGWSRVAQWFHLVVPPLRERPEDIPDLATRCARELIGAAETPTDKPTPRPTAQPTPKPTAVPIFTKEALDRLSRHAWPGNLRELRHAIQRMLLISPRLPIAGSTVEEVLASSVVDAGSTLGPWSGEIRPMREWEDEAIRQALRKTDGNKAAAARLLGLHRNTVVMRTKGEKGAKAPRKTK